ncbi:MAG TPA: NRDE family protein [Blastocatellia bacterium]|nr:NRDE family protein [Blastocatellia bacterium]
MCTVSWLRRGDGYELLFNRDERHTRKPALAPRMKELRGARYIAPADGDFGGAWVGVNQFGLTLALLNRYDDSTLAPSGERVSRGLLLPGLLDSRSCAEVYSRFARLGLPRYQPFTLVALAPAEPLFLARWTGRECLMDADAETAMPLSSSSFDTQGVVESRRRLFGQMAARQGGVDADLLYAFHRSHEPARGPYSVCMHRDDAATVSFSWIQVAGGSIRFIYHPASPCSFDPSRASALEMRLTNADATRVSHAEDWLTLSRRDR